MPSGPSLYFNANFPDRVKMHHTMDPAYAMSWKKYPSPAQQVAVQQLNEQGLYPSKNNRSDFSGGQYPATIKLAPTGKPGCEGYYYYGACSCNSCCPGQTATPMSQIVARPSCSRCPGSSQPHQALQSPGPSGYSGHGHMATVNKHQAQALGRQVPVAFAQSRYGGRASCRGCGANQYRGGY